MKLVLQLAFLFFIITLFIIFCFSQSSSYGNFKDFFVSPIFVFAACNAIIYAIIIVECGTRQVQDFDGLIIVTLFGFVLYEVGEEEIEEIIEDELMSSDSDDHKSSGSYFNDSDGYDSDIEWSDDDEEEEEDDDDEKDECDDNLESRIEEFIAKMIKGWREELVIEKSKRQAK